MSDIQRPVIREGSEEHRLDIAFDEVRKTLDGRNPSYKVPPAEYVDIEILIAQMVLKAERARQAVGVEKQIDEVRDTAGYAMLILGRLLFEATTTSASSILSDEEIVRHDEMLQRHINATPGTVSSVPSAMKHRGDKTKEEFSMFSDGYHQALQDNGVICSRCIDKVTVEEVMG